MTLLRYSLEKGEKDYTPLFQELKIMETGEKYPSYMGKYLMVSVSLKSEKDQREPGRRNNPYGDGNSEQ